MKKPTFLDIVQERPSELMKHYKINEVQMGQHVRKHSMDIKTQAERRAFYEKVYDNRNKK